MPKRGRSRSASTRRTLRRDRTPSRMRAASVPPTPMATAQRGRTMARTGSLARSVTRSLSRVAGAAARRVPYVGQAMAAYDAVQGVRSLFGGNKQTKNGGGNLYNAKSAGFFSGAANRYSNMDKHAKAGVVAKYEVGSLKSDSQNNVVYLAHSTAPVNRMMEAACGALLKKLYMLAKITVKSWDSLLADEQTYNQRVSLYYKPRDGSATVIQNFVVSYTTETLALLTSQLTTFMFTLQGVNTPDQFLKIQLYNNIGLTSSANILVASIDLTTAKFEFDIKSLLKIQNRTINSAGNDTAEDVDNVPLYGKFYEYKTNGTTYQDYRESVGPSLIVTHPSFGVLATNVVVPGTGIQATNMYKEVPLQSQLIGCKSSGKAHIEPGEVKTSVINDSITIPFNKFLKTYLAKQQNEPGGNPRYTQFWIGKSRLFCFERMIQTIASGDAALQPYSLAYEHQLDIGATCHVKTDYITAPLSTQSYPVQA